MNYPDLNQIVDHTFKSLKIILDKKGHDYAGEDAIANMKRVPAIARLYKIDYSKNYHYPLLMVLMKFDRLQNLISQGKTPKNESVIDTLDDAINYALLMKATLIEELDASEKPE